LIILRKIWLLWAVLLFLLMMGFNLLVLFLNSAVFPEERALRYNIWWLHHAFTNVFLPLIGVFLVVEGRDQLDPAKSYVIVGNHKSSLDFILNARAYPGGYQYLAKQELQKIPIFGWVVKKMCLIVDRGSPMSRARSVVMLKQKLAKGISIFIYPEGSRNRTTEPLGPFYDGAFRIAIQTGAPIAVQTITNINRVAGPDDSWLQPGVIRIVWERPIETAQLTDADIPALRENVASMMTSRILEVRK